MSSSSLRALVGARVSVVRGAEKVSHLAQRATGERWVSDHGHQVVGTFEDLDVSADKFDPWRRPDLGQWLTEERSYDWDVIVFSKVDRAFRSIRDCAKFTEWIKQRKKILVFAEDNFVLDYRNTDGQSLDAMMAEFFVMIASFFAAIELNRFRTRSLDVRRTLRYTDRWVAGNAPFGFKVIPHPSGKGKTLATDEQAKRLLHEMAGHLLEGWSFNGIARELNDRGVITARGTAWSTSAVVEALTSLKTQGVKMRRKGSDIHHGDPVLTPDGEYIRLAPPTFDDATWTQLQAAAAVRRTNRRSRVHSLNPLLGVGKCGVCGASLALRGSTKNGRTYRYYGCAKPLGACKGVTMRADEAEEVLEDTFLTEVGHLNVIRRVFVPGEDYTAELEDVKRRISGLRREYDSGLILEDDESEYFERLSALTAHRKELEKLPQRPAGWSLEKTDRTYAEVWASADWEARRKLLADGGVAFTVYSKLHKDIFIPKDVMEQAYPGWVPLVSPP